MESLIPIYWNGSEISFLLSLLVISFLASFSRRIQNWIEKVGSRKSEQICTYARVVFALPEAASEI